MSARLLLLFLLLTPSVLHAQATLEVFDDPAFTQRSGTMTGPEKTLYVRLVSSSSPPGYTGLEFRLAGLEELSLVSVSWANQPSFILGDLTNGINVAWPTCQQAEALLSFTVFSLEPPQDLEIRVAAHNLPVNPNFPIPVHYLCIAPCVLCSGPLEGDPYVLNPSVAVDQANWGTIKGLYR